MAAAEGELPWVDGACAAHAATGRGGGIGVEGGEIGAVERGHTARRPQEEDGLPAAAAAVFMAHRIYHC